jgi:phosphatidylglycerophosphatase A
LNTFKDRVWEWTAVVLGTGLGVGYSPILPGTVGSLWGPWVVLAMQSSGATGAVQALITVVMFIVGVPICGRAAKHFSREDPGAVVWDEIWAFPVVFIGIPVTLATGVLGFLYFRVFDMTKPWPIRRLERFHGGLGIMIDDQLAAVFAWICLYATVYFFDLAPLWPG